MARLALVALLALLGGCTTSRIACERPAYLDDDLSGEEYVARARAWQEYGLCLDGTEAPPDDPGVSWPVVEPVEEPWKRGERLEREKRKRQEAATGEVRKAQATLKA